MKNKKNNIHLRLLLLFVAFGFLSVSVNAQEIKWLRVSDLVVPVNDVGAVAEGDFTQGNTCFNSWPALYGIHQETKRADGLWIGCKNFDDAVANKVLSYKVIGVGPRPAPDRINQIFEKSIKFYGKNTHPIVVVDDQNATVNNTYDVLDEVDETIVGDRMVLVEFNTSIGVSVTQKTFQFVNSEHGNYIVRDYVFKNTGIINRNGEVKQQTLQDVWFYWVSRFAFAGEANSGYGQGWAAWADTWGDSQVNVSFGEDPSTPEFNDTNSPFYKLRGAYSYRGPATTRSVTYEEDWGLPNEGEDGVMAAAKYAGVVALHADKSPQDPSDDIQQPATTWYISSDISAMNANSQYDEVFMADRYSIMSEGKVPVGQHHNEVVGDDYPMNYSDPRRQTGGGASQGMGFGPYTLAPGDSIHIIFAEGIAGLSREKNREVGANWLQYYLNSPNLPTLVMPDGSTTTDHNLYKRRWVETCKDSVIKMMQAAKRQYDSGFTLPSAPPAPNTFTVTSGGDKIMLDWSDNAVSSPNFNGYVIYRSQGNVLDPTTRYTKIFECEASNAVHTFDDVTALRGNDYYYYIQSKDDGTQNTSTPGLPIYSSALLTVTSVEATLQRPAVISTLDSVRVVPNPYDIRSRMFQFGDNSQYDRIAFYGLPPECKMKIYTERGDLIWEKDHTRGTGDELWDSTTSSGQIISSGIYILYVEAPDGRNVIRKFVVIR
ncbi:MAG: hypothetical protein V1720_10185 [bacterium]